MGGGVMRTAAKVAGIGTVMHGGLRGSSLGVQSVRSASIPVTSATGVSAQSLKVSQEEKAWVEASSAAAVEEWEVIGDEGELVMSAGEPMPRVVFGAAPSYKEAREATEELKHALDKAYLSSAKVTELEEQTAADKVSGLSLFSNAESEAESALISKTVVPQHAYQAFELLSKSPEAQNVVASIACDPNIWDAMMENSAVKKFMESQKNLNQDSYESASESVEFTPSNKVVDEKFDAGESLDLKQLFNDFVGKVKINVNTIVSNLSTFIQNVFEAPADDNGTSRNVVAASGFMGLALMVVMVVLMKRA